MATSPLPRWAATPSPSRPLWRSSGGGGAIVSKLLRSPFTTVLEAVRGRAAPDDTPPPVQAPPAPEHNCAGAFDGIAVVAGDGREERLDGGVFLTWEDVWVTAVDSGGKAATILNGVSGSARPGEVLAIMGPSGCGKTTLLDTLAGGGRLTATRGGRRRTVALSRSSGWGEVAAAATTTVEAALKVLQAHELRYNATVAGAYVTQENVLMATLTVREAIYYSAQIQLPDTMTMAEKLRRADETVREMGLTGTLDTRIGGRSSKGISGGQQKRLSICLDILTRPRLLFLDEPTSGLDSAASFHVMSRIIGLAAREGMTVVAVVHQPCSEVFELFHVLCLLAAGNTIFFGPASMAAEFFASNGYPCPPMRNPSDHFLRTVNKDFDKESEDRLRCMPAVADEAIDILVNSYKSSNTSEVAKQDMRHINEMDRVTIGRNRAGFITKTLVLTRRSFVNMYRDIGYYWLRMAIYISISACLGTIFYNMGYGSDSIRARSSMLMFISTMLTLMAIGGFPSFVEDMKIFSRERLNGHYGVSTFVISNTLSSTPYLLLIAVIPGAIAYYLSGLQRQIEHFVYFTLVLCSCTMLVEGLMMIVATIVPDFLMGIITGAGIQGIMMLTSGFFQLPNSLPNIVWKYPMYYISFHKYALQGFYKNEFSGLVLNLEGPITVSGEKVIAELFQVETGHSKWVDLAVLCGMIMTYRLLFVVIIKVLDIVKPILKGMTFRCNTKCIHGIENLCTPSKKIHGACHHTAFRAGPLSLRHCLAAASPAQRGPGRCRPSPAQARPPPPPPSTGPAAAVYFSRRSEEEKRGKLKKCGSGRGEEEMRVKEEDEEEIRER
uniref:ABC transporter domain-containing protein n=1 Tax=Oryza meridionalis TaxID=40149 RepID=A0A0E0EPM2_9ORYZ